MAVFTTVSKNKVTWEAREQAVVTTDVFLNIGDGYNLKISNDYKLIIGEAISVRSDTPWTPITKDKVNY